MNDVLYLVTPYQSLVAVEPETGKQIWPFAIRTPAARRAASHTGPATR